MNVDNVRGVINEENASRERGCLCNGLRAFFAKDVRTCNLSLFGVVAVLTGSGATLLSVDDSSDLFDDWKFHAGVSCLSVALLVSTSWVCYLATKTATAEGARLLAGINAQTANDNASAAAKEAKIAFESLKKEKEKNVDMTKY